MDIRDMKASFVLALTCLLFSVTQASGQPLAFDFQSVQCATARSDLIVRAVISEVAEYEPKNVFGFRSVTFKVLETLKGEPSEELQIAVQHALGHFDLQELKRDQQELLLFLSLWKTTRSASQSYYHYGQTRFPYAIDNAIVLDASRPRWKYETTIAPMSNDMAELGTPAEIIAAIKTYLHDFPAVDAKSITTSVRVPDRLNIGGIPGRFEFVLNSDHVPAGFTKPKATPRFTDFSTVLEQFCEIEPPSAEELNPTYDRTGAGYVGIESMEFMAADSDLIVRAIPLETCFVASAGDAPTTGPMNALKLRVVETFKGTTDPEFICLLRDTRGMTDLIEAGQEMVLFLRRANSPQWSDLVQRFDWISRSEVWDDSVIVLNDQAEVLFAHMSWHRDSKSILKRLREIGSASTTNLPMVVHPPASLVKGTTIEGNQYAMIYLPVDSALESNARIWAKSENPDLRWLAAKSLLHFKSDENAAILKSMLKDNATWGRKETYAMLGSPPPQDPPKHLIRWEARQILWAWGYRLAEEP